MLINRLSAASAACAVAAIIGGLGTWVSIQSAFGTISLSGSEGDGKIVALIGAATGILLGLRAFSDITGLGIAGFIGHGINASLGIWKWSDFHNEFASSDEEMFLVNLSWGIPLIVVSSIAGLIAELASLNGIGKTGAQLPQQPEVSTTPSYLNQLSLYNPDTPLRRITVEPTSGPPNTEVTIYGKGFSPAEEVKVWWLNPKGSAHSTGIRALSRNGETIASAVVPKDAQLGSHVVQFRTSAGDQASAAFIVAEVPSDSSAGTALDQKSDGSRAPMPASQLVVHPMSGPVGTEVVIRATGFYFDDEPVVHWIDGSGRVHQSRSKPVSTDQGFVGRLAVPTWEMPGMRGIRISTPDGRSASVGFEVTAPRTEPSDMSDPNLDRDEIT